MDLVKSKGTLFFAIVCLTLLRQVFSQQVYVAAPNTFRVGERETVAVYTHSGVQEVTVSLAYCTDKKNALSVSDCLGKKKIIFNESLKVAENDPKIIDVKVKPEDILDLDITGPLEPHYIFLVVKGKSFSKETKVLLTMQSGYVFIQTDKPIYNPDEEVKIRIIRLNEDMVADNTSFTLQIRNPQNTIVHSLPNKELGNTKGMYSTVFRFPDYPLYGEWSVTILYGLKVQLNSTVKFELRKYVLPTFEIEVKVPEVILPDDDLIHIGLIAKYVYGKEVEGSAKFILKVQIKTGHTVEFGSCDLVELNRGRANCAINTTFIKEQPEIGWFPGINGAKLVVEALAYERSSGYKENRTVDYTVFAESPYEINFGKSQNTYIAGIDTAIVAQIKHVNGMPARNIEAKLNVKDQNNVPVSVDTPTGVTNDEGFVAFLVKTKAVHALLKVEVKTTYKKYHVSGHLEMHPFKATGNAYVGISRDTKLIWKVGEAFKPSVFRYPAQDIPMSYMVKSKGKIVAAGSLLQKDRHQRSLNIMITADMVPSARVILFATHENQLLVDSLKIEIEKVCNSKGNIMVEVNGDHGFEPGNSVTMTIKGEKDTVVGILAVDNAVYALRNKDKLTRDKMFYEMDKHDMGCGAGGGVDSSSVLANSGLIMITEKSLFGQERKSCVERKRAKRATIDGITRQHGKKNSRCCLVGQMKDKHGRTCEARADIVRNFEGKLHDKEHCAKTFLACCLRAAHEVYGRSNGEQPDNDEIDAEIFETLLENTRERKDFKETWLFEVDVIDSSGVLTHPRNLPDSITTWIVQVVGLSTNGGGMCVTEPVKVVAFKNFFLDVKVPHSVVRNEKIEIPVTIFNYGSETQIVFIFTYGVEGICSDAQPNKRGERKKISIKSNSAATVAFQMIPLEAKKFSIKFSAVSVGGTDTVTKTLNVIAEGVVHEEFFTFVIDPSNSEKRKRRNVVEEKNLRTTFDEENKKQSSILKLEPEFEDIIPGTESVMIDAIGDKFGPTVTTTLENPDKLLALPRGCGEQNMAYTAPTIYTLHYLRATGKLTPEQETKAYKYIREGYNKQQTFRKGDGSFTVWPNKPSSTWLTAFVARVFCQAGRYIFIDENVVFGALKWLVTKQKPDGSFIESYQLHHKEMKGGVTGDVPLTSFVIMAFSQCRDKSEKLDKLLKELKIPMEKAIKYLIDKSDKIEDKYTMAISTYALALYDMEKAKQPNQKLLQMSTFDASLNRRYWGDGKSPLSNEASSYGLMTQILYNDLDKATSIVNFLNSQRNIVGSFWSTQDTVAAIEALSEYAILSRDPEISLVMNISSTSDPSFKETWQFQNNNARVRRQADLKKIGGRLVVDAVGSGVGSFGVTLRYNIANNPDKPSLCQFDVSVNVNEAKKQENQEQAGDDDIDGLEKVLDLEDKENMGRVGGQEKNRFGNIKPGKEFELKELLGENILNRDDLDEPKMIFKRQAPGGPEDRVKIKTNKNALNVTICSRYLKHKETNMVIVDVGMLTGFKPNVQDLKGLIKDPLSLIDRFEENGRNLIIYVEKIPPNKTHCFSFRIDREFIASNLESGLVRVYDYYKPYEACSNFYSSESTGPALSLDCVDAICKCAEGGCPKDPYEKISNVKDIKTKRAEVSKMACNDHDYFFKVLVKDKKLQKSSYIHYNLQIVKVLKEGREKRDEVEGEFRKFVSKATCETSNLIQNRTYYLMGRDQEPRQVGDKITYIYFIDKSSTVRQYFDLKKKDMKPTRIERNVQTIFSYVENLFNNDNGCED